MNWRPRNLNELPLAIPSVCEVGGCTHRIRDQVSNPSGVDCAPPTDSTRPARPAAARPLPPHMASHPAPQIDATRLAGPVPAHRQPPGQLSRIPTAPSPPVRIPHGFRQTDTHMIRVISPRPYAPRPTAPIPTRSTGPTRLDHTGPMCTAPAGPVPASPTFDHHTYARPASAHTRGDTPVSFRRTSSDHGFPCVQPL